MKPLRISQKTCQLYPSEGLYVHAGLRALIFSKLKVLITVRCLPLVQHVTTLFIIVMRQYHIAYTLFIESMVEFKKNMESLEHTHIQNNMVGEKITNILDRTDVSIDIAEREKFLPCSELLYITEKLLSMKDNMGASLQAKDCLRKCFYCLDRAAKSMMLITNDDYITKVRSLTKHTL